MAVRKLLGTCATGRKIAHGVVAVTGSSTNIATGLAAVEACVVAAKSATAGAALALATWNDGAAAGQISLYVWKPTSATDTTLIAATAAANVSWLAIGT